MSLRDVLKEEFIGVEIEVIDAKNDVNIGLKGRVVDETKYTFVIEQRGTIKRLIKEAITIRVMLNKKTYEIQGKLLVSRPEDRLKKRKLI